MTDMLESEDEPLDYLALGPLGNLALLEEEVPGTLARLSSIYVPARISPDGVIDAWNLSYDPVSAATVMESAREVLLVDISVRQRDPGEIFADVRGESIASEWIAKLRSSAAAHLMLCDELAALALVRPEMISIGRERYSFAVGSDGWMRLEPETEGNVRIARFGDPDAAIAALLALWESGPAGHPHEGISELIEPESYIKAFHGHLGPYLVLGYRMGRLALSELDSPGHFGLSVTVHSALEPPRSCLIDGIQLGSGCTLGKRNIDLRATEGPAYAVFRSDRGSEVSIRLVAGVPQLIGRMIEESGVEEAGRRLMDMSSGELFEIIRTAPRREP
jgi:hypothetical protein